MAGEGITQGHIARAECVCGVGWERRSRAEVGLNRATETGKGERLGLSRQASGRSGWFYQTHPPSRRQFCGPSGRGGGPRGPPRAEAVASGPGPFGDPSVSFWPAAALSTDPSVLGKYRAGFSECMNEVTRFLSTCEGVNTEVRTRLLGHLANCMTQINAMTYPGQPHPVLQAPPPPPPGPGGPQHAPFAPPPPLVPIPGGAAPPPGGAPCKLGSPAGEAAKVFGGFQVVPAPDGQFAFLIPNGAFAHSGPVIPVYTSNSGTSVGPNAVSPSSGPSLTADSMWRPWRN